jgi:hypothetical protein
MKKLIAIGFVLVLALYNFNILSRAQDSSVSGEEGGNPVLGLIEDSIIRDASQEMSEILKDLAAAARQSGQSKDIKPLIRSIRRNLDALKYASRSLPPEKCALRLNEATIQKTLTKLEKFDDNLCDNQDVTPSNFTFDPRFEQKVCVVGSPNFFMCICPHRPKYPGCKEYLSNSDEPTCFANEEFEPFFNSVAVGYENLSIAALADSNMNGKPDACENNGELHGEED